MKIVKFLILVTGLSLSINSAGQTVTVDGSFEFFAPVASDDYANSSVTGGGWTQGVGSMDSWISPMPIQGDWTWNPPLSPGYCDGMPPSPDGGVFVGGFAFPGAVLRESIYTQVTNLKVGEPYVVKFYQGHGGIDGRTPLGLTGRWEVQLGAEVQYSNYMPFLGEGNQVWEYQELIFTPTSTSHQLEFTVNSSSGNGTTHRYMVLDGMVVEPICDVDIKSSRVCIGETAYFEADTTAENIVSWNWDFGDGNTSTLSDPQYIYTSAGDYNVFVTVEYQSGCIVADDTLFRVDALPIIDAGMDTGVCENEDVALVAFCSGGTFLWNNGVMDNVPFKPSQTATYIASAISPEGCSSEDSLVVTVLPLPDIDAGLDTSICEGEELTLSASSASGVNFVWDNSVTDNVSFVPSRTITYTVSTTDISGCSNEDIVVVTVNPLPNLDFYTVFENASPDESTVKFINTSTNAVTYEWNFGDDSELDITESPSHTYIHQVDKEFSVTLIATSLFNCIDSLIKVIQLVTPVEYLTYIPNAFTPDGNGLNDVFKIETEGLEYVKLYIFNRWGELIHKDETNENPSWDGKVDGVPAGPHIYTWRIKMGLPNGIEEVKIGHVTLLR